MYTNTDRQREHTTTTPTEDRHARWYYGTVTRDPDTLHTLPISLRELTRSLTPVTDRVVVCHHSLRMRRPLGVLLFCLTVASILLASTIHMFEVDPFEPTDNHPACFGVRG